MCFQGSFDLAKFNAEPANFDLEIDPSEEFDITILENRPQIAGLVESRFSIRCRGERVVDEFLFGQFGLIEIPMRQTDATNINLAGTTDRHRLHPGIENVDLDVGQAGLYGLRLRCGIGNEMPTAM